MVYVWILAAHNLVRWLVLLTLSWALFRVVGGAVQRRTWTEDEGNCVRWFTNAIDMQMTLGLLLYFFFSPVTRVAFTDMGAVMDNDTLRFFAVEHITAMVLAVVFAHIANMRTKSGSDMQRYRDGLIWLGLAALAIVVGVPWWRPLLPALFGVG